MKSYFFITAPIVIFLYSCGDFPPYKEIVVSATTIPSNPTGVTAAAGDRQVTVSWSSVSGAASYNLYWSTNSGAGKSGTKIGGVISPYTHIGLTNGTTYYYVVTAVNSIGESEVSSQVSAAPSSSGGGITTTTGGTTIYEVEPNNSSGEAQNINADSDYTGQCSFAYDEDFFSIKATGSIMTVSLTHITQNDSQSDFRIYILVSTSIPLIGSFDAYNGVNNSMTIGVKSGQIYYIRVSGVAAGPWYKLRVSFS